MTKDKIIENVNNQLQKIGVKPDAKLVEKLATNYRVVMAKSDAKLVACGQKSELERIKTNFLKKKLGLKSGNEKLDELLAKVCDKMKPIRQKNRIAFYYLLVKEARKTSVFK